jgi:hypothetical protein
MGTGFWIGLLLSIPISILANLFTPRIQVWLDSRNKKRALARTKNLQREYDQTRKYRENRGEFREYMLWVVIRATFVGALTGILTSLAYMIANFYQFSVIDSMGSFRFSSLLFVAAQFLSLIGTLLVVNICSSALKVYYRVKNFEIYEESAKKNLAEKMADTSVVTSPESETASRN